ncbi:MAG: hypothetical protein ACM31O_06200 [Bacteroidota bacterium]
MIWKCRVGQVAGLSLIFAAGVSAAQEDADRLRWMPADAIRLEFSGKSLAGIYPDGKAWTEVIFTDGTSDYREKHVRRPGKWWITPLEFCFSYPPPGEGGCFRVVKMSPNCYELYEYGSEQGRQDAPPRQQGSWNGRMWRTETAATCDEKPSV